MTQENSFNKKTIRDVNVSNKRILVRVDFNVPLEDDKVADDTRIRATLPTIRYLAEHNSRLILCSHLDRPGGKFVPELTLDPVAKKLSELVDYKVKKVNDTIGTQVEEEADKLERGEILLLENTRFHPGEKANDPDFAAQLANLADIYVDDAFATAHRAHASTEGVTHYLPSVAGLMMKDEIQTLENIRKNPKKPLVMIFGGAKVSGKIRVLEEFLDDAEKLLIGGGIANTFFKAKGFEVGDSLIDEESLETARETLNKAEGKIILPVDAIIAQEPQAEAEIRTTSVDSVPAGWQILDIGPKTVQLFKEQLNEARMVVWNGPMGLFEKEPFAQGTFAIAQALAELDAETITGGGETAAAVSKAGIKDQLTHVSTGGGAFLTFLEGAELPAVAALDDK